MVSYLGSRRQKPSWVSASEWEGMEKVNSGSLATYYKAKIVADEELYLTAKKRGSNFAGICLRPGTLSTEPRGTVQLGKLETVQGKASRESVAGVADELLATEGVKTSWIDMIDGSDEIGKAVAKVVSEEIDAIEGEPVLERSD